jgi:Condensation domain
MNLVADHCTFARGRPSRARHRRVMSQSKCSGFCRCQLFILSQSEQVLLLVLHHIAADGWSLGRDLSRAYAARVQGAKAQWPALPIHYADYTLCQQQLLGSENDPQPWWPIRVSRSAALSSLRQRNAVSFSFEWNATACDLPQVTSPASFEAQAERGPEAIALVFEESALGYGELNAQANRLAHYLTGHGISQSNWKTTQNPINPIKGRTGRPPSYPVTFHKRSLPAFP